MPDDRGPFPRQRDLPLRHRRQQLQQIGAVESQRHAGRSGGARQVDGANARMRYRAAGSRVVVLTQIHVREDKNLRATGSRDGVAVGCTTRLRQPPPAAPIISFRIAIASRSPGCGVSKRSGATKK